MSDAGLKSLHGQTFFSHPDCSDPSSYLMGSGLQCSGLRLTARLLMLRLRISGPIPPLPHFHYVPSCYVQGRLYHYLYKEGVLKCICALSTGE